MHYNCLCFVFLNQRTALSPEEASVHIHSWYLLRRRNVTWSCMSKVHIFLCGESNKNCVLVLSLHRTLWCHSIFYLKRQHWILDSSVFCIKRNVKIQKVPYTLTSIAPNWCYITAVWVTKVYSADWKANVPVLIY